MYSSRFGAAVRDVRLFPAGASRGTARFESFAPGERPPLWREEKDRGYEATCRRCGRTGGHARQCRADSADPPANQVEVPITCPSTGRQPHEVPNIGAALENGKTLVTGIGTDDGPGIVFDLFGIYDVGRGKAPVYEGKATGVADELEICLVDLSEILGPCYVVPAAVKLPGQAA